MTTLNKVIFVAAAIYLLGCNAGKGFHPGEDPEGSGEITVNLKSVSSGSVTNTLSNQSPLQLDYGSAGVGSTGLSSFQMYISDIQLCEFVDINGANYSNPTNCYTVYQNEKDDFASFDVADAKAASTGKYFNLLSDGDLATYTSTSDVRPGTYNYAIVNWYEPVKMTATVKLPSEVSLYTKECPGTEFCTVSNMQVEPAEESVFDFNSSGTWVKFLSPLEVSGGEDLTVDLNFDLENKLFAGRDISFSQITDSNTCTLVNSASDTCGMYMPILRFNPVIHGSDASPMVETYEMEDASSQWKLRVDVYYASDDPDQTISAAEMYTIPTEDTDSNIPISIYVFKVEVEDEFVQFEDSSGRILLGNFTRGDSGTASFACPIGSVLADCPTNSRVTLSWSSRTIRKI